MSRFDEAIEESIDKAVLRGSFRAETLAGDIAELVRERQGGRLAEVSLAARYPRLRRAPISGAASQEVSTLLGAASATPKRVRQVVGVEAQGITACPCGQAMATEGAHERLAHEGFDDDEIERVLACVPVVTHNQRGLGTLWVGLPDDPGRSAVEPEALLAIVESSMSSEVYELLKRPDEAHIVEKAHRRPRFVEDCVREMVRMAVERLGHLGASASAPAGEPRNDPPARRRRRPPRAARRPRARAARGGRGDHRANARGVARARLAGARRGAWARPRTFDELFAAGLGAAPPGPRRRSWSPQSINA